MVSLVLYALCFSILSHFAGVPPAPLDATVAGHELQNARPAEGAAPEGSDAHPVAILTVLYDNKALRSDLRSDHGFACLVEGFEQTVLFDTGARGDILLANMEALGVDPCAVDAVVLSHAHGDHTGGLSALLAVGSDVVVYCPAAFSEAFVRTVQAAGATVIRVESATSLCPGLTVTAPLGTSPSEVGLLIETTERAAAEGGGARDAPAPGSAATDGSAPATRGAASNARPGALLLTGCAHPGIVVTAEAATDLTGGTLAAVMGGFHLGGASVDRVETIIRDLKQLGVERCGPAHCTGETATALMREVFGPGFIDMGVGAVVEF